MSSTRLHESEAEASNEPAPKDAVAGLISLSVEDRNYLDSYSIETCAKKIEELISYVNNPAEKQTRTKLDVLGQLTLLYQRAGELQNKKISRLKQKNSRLQQENSRLQQEAR